MRLSAFLLMSVISSYAFGGNEPSALSMRSDSTMPKVAVVDSAVDSRAGALQAAARSKPALSYTISYHPGRSLVLDDYTRKWLRRRGTWSMAVQVNAESEPLSRQHESTVLADYAHDYGYPSFSLGLRMYFNHGTRMYRSADISWPLIEPVSYESHLGNAITLYGLFNRQLWRGKQFDISYTLGTGLAWFGTVYNPENNIDDELIGSHLNIFFTAGISARYWVSRHVAINAGIDFSHHSNGALYRPNKGANYFGPFVGLTYQPAEHQMPSKGYQPSRFNPYWFMEFSLGVGAKTLLEDWQRTQFQTPPSDPDYRTDRFAVYGAFSLQTDVMYRYARRWASGVGVDVFYGDYAQHVAQMDRSKGYNEQVSPWSVGFALKHEVFFGNLSARMGIGVYAYRHMGQEAKAVEKPYYERIGVHYSFPQLGGLGIGFNINAHLTKADFTEIEISMPLRLSGKHQ